MIDVRLTITVPAAGDSPSGFRRSFVEAIRDTAAHLHFDGQIDAAVVEEIFRAVPVEEARR